MNELRMVLSPGPTATRVIAISGSATESETVLKARLSPTPSHPRAVQWLLEAMALWQGTVVRAALCAGRPGRSYVTGLYPDWFADFGNALYTLELCEARRPGRRHQDAVGGMGDFRDLRQLSLDMGGAR
jgi:hypothetical protein